jgi:hypothetical protein
MGEGAGYKEFLGDQPFTHGPPAVGYELSRKYKPTMMPFCSREFDYGLFQTMKEKKRRGVAVERDGYD